MVETFLAQVAWLIDTIIPQSGTRLAIHLKPTVTLKKPRTNGGLRLEIGVLRLAPTRRCGASLRLFKFVPDEFVTQGFEPGPKTKKANDPACGRFFLPGGSLSCNELNQKDFISLCVCRAHPLPRENS